jgi:signal transduction histidine kinase
VVAADLRLRHRGEEVGALGVATDGGELPEEARRLLDRLAGTAGLALANVRLTFDLRERIAESRELSEALERSRQRLLDAAAEETERFARLVADRVQAPIQAAAAALDAVDSTVDPAVADATRWVRTALEELRELAAGVFPPTLPENGLLVALETLTGRYGGQVVLRHSGDGPCPPWSVEAAAYRCVLELLEDATADAVAGRVLLEADQGTAGVVVRMDLDRTPAPDVLQLLRDRVDATDGTLEVEEGPDVGASQVVLRWER